MQVISGDDIHRLLDFPSLIDALRAMFRDGCEAPPRHHYRISAPTAEGRLIKGFEGLDVGDQAHVKLVRTDVARGFIDFERLT